MQRDEVKPWLCCKRISFEVFFCCSLTVNILIALILNHWSCVQGSFDSILFLSFQRHRIVWFVVGGVCLSLLLLYNSTTDTPEYQNNSNGHQMGDKGQHTSCLEGYSSLIDRKVRYFSLNKMQFSIFLIQSNFVKRFKTTKAYQSAVQRINMTS